MVDLESLEVVDEDIGEPEVIDQLNIHWDHGSGVVGELLGGGDNRVQLFFQSKYRG